MTLLKENKILQRSILQILSDDSIEVEDKRRLQENFTKNFYEVIKISFDSSITKEKLSTIRVENPNDPKYLLTIAKVIENKSTYTRMNQFLKSYLNILQLYLLNN